MSSPESFSFESLRQRIQEAAKSGHDLKERVRTEVNDALHQARMDNQGFRDLVKAVLDGAADGFAHAAPPERSSRFHAVFDGLLESFVSSADALRLTIEEAAGRGRKFAAEDLRQAASNFENLGDLFKSVVSDITRRTGSEARGQWQEFEQHAGRAWERLRPNIEAAARAAREQPWQTGREGLQAGVGAATEAAGALLREVGQRLAALGDHLRRPGRE